MERVGLIGFRTEGKKKIVCVGRLRRPTHNFLSPLRSCARFDPKRTGQSQDFPGGPFLLVRKLEKRKALDFSTCILTQIV